MTESNFTYKLFINMNQCPGDMVRRKEEWEECIQYADGLWGPFCNCPKGSMSMKEAKHFIGYFEGKETVYVTNWNHWKGHGGMHWNHTNMREHDAERYNFKVGEDIFIFDCGGKFLSVEQLDEVREAGWPPVLINLRNWGPKGTSDEWTEDIKASIAHPWCRGVVVEGNAQVYYKPRNNPRQQIAQYAAKTGKPLYLLMPPTPEAAVHGDTHIERVQKMLDALHGLFDGITSPGQVTLVPSFYGEQLEALPARDADGNPANTFAGGILLMGEYKAKQQQC